MKITRHLLTFAFLFLPGILIAAEHFDGTWHTKVACPDKGNTMGSPRNFDSVVTNSNLRGVHGTEGQPAPSYSKAKSSPTAARSSPATASSAQKNTPALFSPVREIHIPGKSKPNSKTPWEAARGMKAWASSAGPAPSISSSSRTLQRAGPIDNRSSIRSIRVRSDPCLVRGTSQPLKPGCWETTNLRSAILSASCSPISRSTSAIGSHPSEATRRPQPPSSQLSLKLVERQNPDLPHRRVGVITNLPGGSSNARSAPSLTLHLEAPPLILLALDQVLHQPAESRLGKPAEFQFVHHGPSLATTAANLRAWASGL